jgi:hypothetical protein
MSRPSRQSLFLLATTVTLASWPAVAGAHVKWFVRHRAGEAGVAPFTLADPAVQVWTAVVLVLVLAAAVLDRRVRTPPPSLTSFAQWQQPQIQDVFQLLVGLALLLTALKGAIVAPHLGDGGALVLALRFLQGAIGVLLMANRVVCCAATLMVGVFVSSTALFGFVSSLEYFNFLGSAVFLLLLRAPATSRLDRWRHYGVPLLRIHLGIALGVLAWTEKLLDPALAIRFLEENQVNFMKALGIESFSDRLFVLSAGSTELLFAIVFVLGLVTRINTLALAGFLVSSNAYFFAVGKTNEAFLELSGHLPLFAIAMILILYGDGGALRLPNRLAQRPNGLLAAVGPASAARSRQRDLI